MAGAPAIEVLHLGAPVAVGAARVEPSLPAVAPLPIGPAVVASGSPVVAPVVAGGSPQPASARRAASGARRGDGTGASR